MEQFYRAIGLLIREKRESLGLSHEKLADRLNLSRTSVTNIEAGNQRILLHHAVQISQTLEVSMSEFTKALEKTLFDEAILTLNDRARAITVRSLELARKKELNEPTAEIAY